MARYLVRGGGGHGGGDRGHQDTPQFFRTTPPPARLAFWGCEDCMKAPFREDSFKITRGGGEVVYFLGQKFAKISVCVQLFVSLRPHLNHHQQRRAPGPSGGVEWDLPEVRARCLLDTGALLSVPTVRAQTNGALVSPCHFEPRLFITVSNFVLILKGSSPRILAEIIPQHFAVRFIPLPHFFPPQLLLLGCSLPRFYFWDRVVCIVHITACQNYLDLWVIIRLLFLNPTEIFCRVGGPTIWHMAYDWEGGGWGQIM